MDFLRIRCPACASECPVAETVGASVRCENCGHLFDPAAAPGHVPPPPTVIYLSGAPANTAPASPRGPRLEYGPPPLARRPAAPEPPAAPPPQPAAAPLRIDLGAPPPYRTVEPVERERTPRTAPEPTPLSATINVRIASALGPPPPYRPINQGGNAFQRGPAPDLDPWRVTTLTRIPPPSDLGRADTSPDGEAEWVLPPPLTKDAQAALEPGRTVRLGTAGELDLPIRWATAEAARYVRPPKRVLRHVLSEVWKPALWTAGIVFAITAGVAGLDIQRDRVMRAFPRTTQIYAAFRLIKLPPPEEPPADTSAIKVPERQSTGLGPSVSDDPRGNCYTTTQGSGLACDNPSAPVPAR